MAGLGEGLLVQSLRMTGAHLLLVVKLFMEHLHLLFGQSDRCLFDWAHARPSLLQDVMSRSLSHRSTVLGDLAHLGSVGHLSRVLVVIHLLVFLSAFGVDLFFI